MSSNVTSSGQLSNTSRQLFDMIKTGSNVINRDELINALRACSKSDLHNVVGLLSQDSGSGEVSTSTTSNQTLTNNPSSSSSLASLESSSKQSGPNEPQQAGEAKLITSDTLPGKLTLIPFFLYFIQHERLRMFGASRERVTQHVLWCFNKHA